MLRQWNVGTHVAWFFDGVAGGESAPGLAASWADAIHPTETRLQTKSAMGNTRMVIGSAHVPFCGCAGHITRRAAISIIHFVHCASLTELSSHCDPPPACLGA